jgi:environmental stress-induced protein Ves
MKLTVLPAADRIAMPWKNGGGITREVAAHPPGSDLDSFIWRVSMAEVAQAGPFSCFPGIDRVLTVIEGALDLTIAGQAPITLTPQSEPYAFAADAPCSAALDAPVSDLNVMVRRGVATARVSRVDPAIEVAGATALFIAAGLATLGDQTLRPLDAVLIDGRGPLPLDGAGWLIEIDS